jgi:multidrug efflux pump
VRTFLNLCIERYRTTLTILVLLLIAGLYARNDISVEASPDVKVPFLQVLIINPGISPDDAERLLLKPVELELRTIDGVDELNATAKESLASFIIRFDSTINIDLAMNDVRAAIDRAREKLPDSIEEPIINEISADKFPTMVVGLSSTALDERELFSIAQTMRLDIEMISDVLSADLRGSREEVVEVMIDRDKLENFNITPFELIQAVNANNQLIPAGEIDTGEGRFGVKVPGLIESYFDVINLPIKSTPAGVVVLSDIAEITRKFKDPDGFSLINGDPAISIEVKKRSGTNQLEVAAQIREVVDSYLGVYADSLTIQPILDQTPQTEQMVNELQGNIVTAVCLVMIIVVGALGFRSGLLVGAGIPVSLLMGTIWIYLLGYSFNFMVMFGMLLALGMLIDGSIVITEYADRRMADGASSRQAYISAARRMFLPVLASTATTLAAFLPMMLWPGTVGDFMAYLPTTVFAVLTSSLVYALVFAPVLGSMFGRSNFTKKDIEHFRVLETSNPTDLKGATGIYARVLARLVRFPVLVTVASVILIVSIYSAYGKYSKGVEFFTTSEAVYGQAAVRARGNLSALEVLEVVRGVERKIAETPGVQTVYTSTYQPGKGSGRNESPDRIATLLIQLVDHNDRELSSAETFELIRQRTADIAGVHVEAGVIEQGPPVGKPIKIELSAADRELLIEQTTRLSSLIQSEVADLRDIDDSRPLPAIEWQIDVDRRLAAQLGANVLEVGTVVQLLTNGVEIGDYRPNDAEEEVEIRARFAAAERRAQQLNQLSIYTPNGSVPLSSIATVSPRNATGTIERFNGRQVMFINADTVEGVLADTKAKEIMVLVERYDWPSELTITFRGANEEQEESAQFLQVAMVLAMFLMAVLLISQFNSFYQAGLIMTAVVMSTAGVMGGLLITGSVFSVILTGVGVVALAGIVVNNNIVLIDTFNVLRRENPAMSLPDVIVRTGAQRLRPVFLTTATTILGLLPIATNWSIDVVSRTLDHGGAVASYWVPLASAIVWGLAFSTLLTLIVTPCMLLLPQALKRNLRWIKQQTMIGAARILKRT